jgi:hypothetical protein
MDTGDNDLVFRDRSKKFCSVPLLAERMIRSLQLEGVVAHTLLRDVFLSNVSPFRDTIERISANKCEPEDHSECRKKYW